MNGINKKVLIMVLNILVIVGNIISTISLIAINFLAPYVEELNNVLETANVNLLSQVILISICILLNVLCLVFCRDVVKNKEKIILCTTISMMIGSLYNIVVGFIIIIALYKKTKGEKEENKFPVLEIIKNTWVTKIIYLIVFSFVFVLSYTSVFSKYISSWNPIIRIIFVYGVHILFLIIPFLKNLKRDIKAFLKNRKQYAKEIVKIFSITILFYIPVTLVLNLILGQSTNQTLIQELPIWFSIIIGVVIAPICEEIMFRGFIRKIIKNDKVFIVISALIFGIIHCMYVEENWMMYLHIIPYAILGTSLAKIYAKTDNILTNISIHFIWNTIAFASMFLLGI